MRPPSGGFCGPDGQRGPCGMACYDRAMRLRWLVVAACCAAAACGLGVAGTSQGPDAGTGDAGEDGASDGALGGGEGGDGGAGEGGDAASCGPCSSKCPTACGDV